MDVAADPSHSRNAPPAGRLAALIDYGERAMLVVLYLLLVQRVLPSLAGAPVNVLLLVSESLVVGFIVFRRRTVNVTGSALEWLMALGGTISPLFLRPGSHGWGPAAVGGVIIMTGILIHAGAKLSLRRSFGMAAANRGVKVGGLYRLVRHPMYLGYAVTWIGFFLLNPTLANGALIAFAAVMQSLRILAEERLLADDPAYSAYMERVRFRVLPGIF